MKNKSIVVLILSILVVLGCGNDMTNTPSGQGPSGQETTSCNISISSYEEFDKIRENLSCNYTLTANIDFASKTDFQPIGTGNKPFTGVLDGAGHTIKNVTIDKSKVNDVGVIGYAKGASIKNLTFEKVAITGKSYVGVIGASEGTIMNVYVKGGTITAAGGVGGLVGYNGGTIKSSYSSAAVTVSAAAVAAGTRIGGLAGYNSGTIENSYATGKVTGRLETGGLVGYSINGTITNSYATGAVNVTNATRIIYVGGLVGKAESKNTIKNSYATGKVTGAGLAQIDSNECKIENSYYDQDGTGQEAGVIAPPGIEQTAIGVSKGTNIVKRDNKYYDSLGTDNITTDDVEIFKGWDFASVWDFKKAGAWPTLKWQSP